MFKLARPVRTVRAFKGKVSCQMKIGTWPKQWVGFKSWKRFRVRVWGWLIRKAQEGKNKSLGLHLTEITWRQLSIFIFFGGSKLAGKISFT